MGSNVPYKVRVLRLVEDVIEVSALTADEALEVASREAQLEADQRAIKGGMK